MPPGSGVPSPPAERTRATCRRAGVSPRAPRRLHEQGRGLHHCSPGGERPRRPPLAVAAQTFKKGGVSPVGCSQSQIPEPDSKKPSESRQLSSSPRAVTSGERSTASHSHGGRGARDRLRAGAAEGGGGGVGARAAEEARRREGCAPAPALHAPVVRRRQRRGDAEDSGRGGGGEWGCGLGRICCLPVLRVAGRLHRELPQEPGLRDHLRPPRHGGVRGGGGGGADDGQLAVQEAGHDGDRGGGGGVRGRGRRRRGVRVGIQRAQQDRPDVHAGLQRLRRLPHRQHRRGALLRGRAPGLVRRHISICTYIRMYI